MRVVCPSCRHQLEVDAPLATGATIRIRCSRCSARFHVDRLTGDFAHHDSPSEPPPRTDAVGAAVPDIAELSAAPPTAVAPPTPRRVEASEPRPERVTADDLYQHGLRLLRAGRLPDARDSFAACLKLDPLRSDCRVQRAITLMRLGVASGQVDFVGLQETFQSAIDADPLNAEAWFGLGTLWGLRGHPNRAIQCFRQVLTVDPGNLEATRAIRLQRIRKQGRDERSPRIARLLGRLKRRG
ncbi:MAG: tetratricopeptide repeat protein [Deltaproteobacteria bacterium]|nr:tetratricopeptide repeat protein [Deltaproteobacteria bacterium]